MSSCYHLTPHQLLCDLYDAYVSARRHKRHKPYQIHFERHHERFLLQLRDELFSRNYKPCPSTAFVITSPKRREVFAASFRDRIVHHLYFSYAHRMFERLFINDSYSCIKGKGTHYGIRRLRHHIASESLNYSRPCYVLKMDISGYFMHINRGLLLDFVIEDLLLMSNHRVDNNSGLCWKEVVDIDFLIYLSKEIILLNPITGCHIEGKRSDWDLLPNSKSLYYSPKGCGLPIGNLTSQLFSNVYLNRLDQYVKRSLGCRHYGRYVDDFYIVSCDRAWLKSLVPRVSSFLKEHLQLSLQANKTQLIDVWHGVTYLGAVVKPHRTCIENGTLKRMRMKLKALQGLADRGEVDMNYLHASLNSFLGVLSHFSTYRICQRFFDEELDFSNYGFFDKDYHHFLHPVLMLEGRNIKLEE